MTAEDPPKKPRNDVLPPSWFTRVRRRWGHWQSRSPVRSWFYIPSYTQYAWNYHTPEEDLVRRQSMIDRTDETTQFPLVPLWPRNQVRDKDTDRQIPYFLRGREQEFNWYARRIINQPKGISLITGPPGVGKSALLAALMEYAQRQGYIIIDLDAQHFLNTNNLCQRMRQAALHQDRIGVLRERRHKGGFDATFGEPETGTSIALSSENEETRENLEKQQVLETIREILAQNPQTPGILITCDEVQNIRTKALENLDHPTWDTIKGHFVALNDDVVKKINKLPVTTIIAGVPPAKQVYEKTLSRSASSSYIHLRPVTTQHCEQIIRDYLNVRDDCGLQPIKYDDENIKQWAADCRGHVLHANNAGQILQDSGIAIARQSIPPDEEQMKMLLDGINDDITIAKDSLYLRQTENAGNSTLVNHLIIAAAQKHHGCIPQKEAQAITSHVLQKDGLPHKPEDVKQAIQPLERYGIIQVVTSGDHFVHQPSGTKHLKPPYWEVAIPSLQSFIAKSITDETTRQQIQQTVAPFLAKAIYDGLPWQCTGSINLAPIPRIHGPGIEYPANDPAPDRNQHETNPFTADEPTSMPTAHVTQE